MAISTEQAISIEFRYDTPGSQEQVWVKYHNTDMGPTLSLSDNRKQWFDFPASLFSEATDFLRQNYGLLLAEGPRTAQPPMLLGRQRPSVSAPLEASTLQPPEVVVDQTMEEEAAPPKPLNVADVSPIQSLGALAAGQFKPAVVPNTLPPAPAPETTSVPAAPVGYAGRGVVVDTRNDPAVKEAAGQPAFGRSVVRSDPNTVAGMTDEELLQQSRLHRGFNEGKGIRRTG